MNGRDGSKWRHGLLMAWFAMGWLIAIGLIVSKSAPFEVARAQVPQQPTPAASKGPYSPIGLTFDNCNMTGKTLVVKTIKDGDVMPAMPANYAFAGAIRHVVTLNDLTDNQTLNFNDEDLLIYVPLATGTSC